MDINWTLQIKTDDGYMIFESDAAVEYTVTRSFGEDIVEVDAFEITPTRLVSDDPLKWEERATPARFSANSKQAWKKLLFFHVQAELEADQSFIDHVLDQEASFDDRPPRDPYAGQRLLACELI